MLTVHSPFLITFQKNIHKIFFNNHNNNNLESVPEALTTSLLHIFSKRKKNNMILMSGVYEFLQLTVRHMCHEISWL